jgi:hypothetical protein
MQVVRMRKCALECGDKPLKVSASPGGWRQRVRGENLEARTHHYHPTRAILPCSARYNNCQR